MRGGRNVEIKARLREPAAQRRRVAELSDRGPEILEQEDTFFPCAEGRFKLRRLSAGRGELIHYHRPDEPGPRESRYEIVATPEPDRVAGVLSRALGTLGVVYKTRTLFLAGRTRIHLDDVRDLGAFVELEVVLEEGEARAAGVREANELMRRIGIRNEDLLARPYIELLMEAAPGGGTSRGVA